MSVPELNLYKKYGDPRHLVEFRLFSFNNCSAGCKNCFYKKTDNNFSNFSQVNKLAEDLVKHGYSLETCYLLPTDVFESEFNYRIFSDESLIEALNRFNYVGFASTLRNGFDAKFLDSIYHSFPHLKIEMHVNLLEELIFDSDYREMLGMQIRKLKTLYGPKILINLAINTGTVFSHSELEIIKNFVEEMSDDKILELNFTFLFNRKMNMEVKTKLLKDSFQLMHYFSNEFEISEKAFNDRTLLRKPSFVFKDDQIYLSPIIPFDEYVFIESEKYRLSDATFYSFLEVHQNIQNENLPLWTECDNCDRLSVCYGKSFFSLANYYSLPCIKEKELL